MLDKHNPGSWPNVFNDFGVRGAEYESIGKLASLVDSGRKDFIRHLFDNRADYAHVPGQRHRPVNFFNDILEPLFYEAIASPRTDEDHYYSRFDCKIPFLNGGLFEPLYGYNWVETEILLPDTLFANVLPTGEENEKGTGILDVFDRYNFTVNEAEPLEKEVAVDPEMLGLVFENLLPENIRHSSGTYYTPRVIVHYMCQQALLHYLTTRAANIPQTDLALFLRLAERFTDFQATETKKHADKRLPVSISGNASRLDDLLANIAVCDPAIGSGAFPVGMMLEIVRARMALAAVEGMPAQTLYHLKRHAIQHSLYGVDLGGSEIEYLPSNHGKVVCGCFTPERNPEAPDIIIPGTGKVREREAQQFCEQEIPVPIFIKRQTNEWEYVGDYKADRFSTDPTEIEARHQGSITPLEEITRVIYLKQISPEK